VNATIIAHPESQRNATTPICSNGCGPVHFSSSACRIYCPACGLELVLTPDETSDLTNALIGLNPELRLDLFLAGIVRHKAIESVRAV
jgi:hypothetical protein